MQFIDSLQNDQNVKNKLACHPQCDFRDHLDIPIVGIAPPINNNLKGVIISRDPTTDFISVYCGARKGRLFEKWHELIKADAPPQWLIKNIYKFNNDFLDNKYTEDIRHLESLINNNVYWTHLHKCCTYNRKDTDIVSDEDNFTKIPFSYKNAKLCSETWLREELIESINQGAMFIICLGRDVERCIKPWENDLGISTKNIFYLRHPSGSANGYWFNETLVKKYGLEDKIITLLKLTKRIN